MLHAHKAAASERILPQGSNSAVENKTVLAAVQRHKRLLTHLPGKAGNIRRRNVGGVGENCVKAAGSNAQRLRPGKNITPQGGHPTVAVLLNVGGQLGVFVWSAEEDTPAYDLPDRVSEKEGSRRMDIIMEEQSRVIDSHGDEMIGKEISVVVEGFDRLAECCFGRSEQDAPDIDGKVFFSAEGQRMTAGDIVRVRVTDRMECDLVGEKVED